MLKAFGAFRDQGRVENIYEEMKEKHVAFNEITLGCLIDALIKNNKLDKAFEIVEKENEPPLTTIMYTMLIKGFSKEKKLAKALDLVESMKQTAEAKPNIVTYNSLMDCAVSCREFTILEKIYKELTANKEGIDGVIPDLITHSTYIKGLCKARQSLKAF